MVGIGIGYLIAMMLVWPAKMHCRQIELHFFFGSGLRIYYTIKNDKIVLLVTGGDKSSQSKNIVKARNILMKLED